MGRTGFTQDHISSLLKGVEDAGLIGKCEAVLSGYMGPQKHVLPFWMQYLDLNFITIK